MRANDADVDGADTMRLQVWDLQTGRRMLTLRRHTGGVTCVQFSSSKIVSGSYDCTIKVWDFSV